MAAPLEDALLHHQAGRDDQAEALYSAILATEPTEPTALYLSGLLHIAAGRIEIATERLSALVEVRPGHVASQLVLANLHSVAGNTAKAIEIFARVTAIVPDHVGAQLGLAEECLSAGRPEAALLPAQRARQATPGDSRALLALCRALLGVGQTDAALDVAERIDQASCDAWLWRGACLKALCRLEEASLALRQAIDADPRRTAARLNLGTLCAELGYLAEAEDSLRHAIAIDPSCAEAQASLGSVLLLTGRVDDAEICFRAALRHNPDLVAAHQNLAAILTERRHHDQARHHRRLAYRQQNLFVEYAPASAPRVLLLATGGGGNVPTQFLLPRRHTTRLTWIVDHATGGQPATLPAFDLVFNTIGDADMAAEAEPALTRFSNGCGMPLLNPPARVAQTRRDRLPTLLAGIDGLLLPAVRRLQPGTRLDKASLPLPVLLRPAGSHGGRDIKRVEHPEELARLWIVGPEPCYATAFHDTRSADGQYRKFRVIFVSGQSYFYHLAISAAWLVHYETAGMMADPAKQCEEARFLADPEAVLGDRAVAAISTVGRRLGLDFGGADFALLADGRVLIFEANATMLVHPEAVNGPLAYRNAAVEPIFRAFGSMVARVRRA